MRIRGSDHSSIDVHIRFGSGFPQPVAATKASLLVVVVTLMLFSCARQPVPEGDNLPGFFLGYWHGLTIIYSLVWHLFDHSVRIYAFPNSGGWYDFGFALGAGSILGGSASAATRKEQR